MHGIGFCTFCMTKRHLEITAYLYVRPIISHDSVKIFYVTSYPDGLSQPRNEFEPYGVFMNDSLLIMYRLCGLVVSFPAYRSRGPGSIPGATRFSEK
jgi:hypothetical protein